MLAFASGWIGFLLLAAQALSVSGISSVVHSETARRNHDVVAASANNNNDSFSGLGTQCVQEIRIGALFPMSTLTGQVDPSGIQRVASFIMAVNDINASPQFQARQLCVKFALRDSKRSFANAAMAAMELSTNTFRPYGLLGVIGSGDNIVSAASAYILQDFDITQISYGSDDAALSHGDVYPNFMRVYSPFSLQGTVFADIVGSYYGWRRVVVLYSSDMNGTDALAEFQSAAGRLNVEIISSIRIDLTQPHPDYSSDIADLMRYDPRIFVMLVSSAAAAAAFIEQAYTQGLLSIGKTIVLGTDRMSSSVLWTSFSDPSQAQYYLSGYLSLGYANSDWLVTNKGEEFIAKFRTQPNTISYHSSSPGTAICDTSKDDDGGFYLYQIEDSSTGNYTCCGQNFSSYNTDGTDITPYGAFIYDATVSLVQGIVTYADRYNGGNIPSKVNGTALKLLIIDNETIADGYSGKVAFSKTRLSSYTYGAGDRIVGIPYALNNFQYSHDSSITAAEVANTSSFTMRRVGTWRSESGLTLCVDDLPVYQSSLIGGCSSVDYGGSTADQLPSDRAADQYLNMPVLFKAALYTFGCVEIVVVLCIGGTLSIYAENRILKASQPAMMWLVLAVGVYGCIRVFLSAADINEAVCVADYWLGHLSSTGVIAVFTKTLRVHFIVNTKGVKRVKITTRQVLTFTLLSFAVMTVYMIICTSVNTPTVLETSSTAITGQISHQYSCTSSIAALDYVLYAFEGALLLLLVKLCYDTRNVPDAINESGSVGSAVSWIIIVAAVVFTLTRLPAYDSSYILVDEFVAGLGFFLATTGALILYFLPKLLLIYNGVDLGKNFELVRRPTTTSKQSIPPGSSLSLLACGGNDVVPVPIDTLEAGGMPLRSSSLISKYIRTPVPYKADELAEVIEHLRSILIRMELLEVSDMRNLDGGGGDKPNVASNDNNNNHHSYSTRSVPAVAPPSVAASIAPSVAASIASPVAVPAPTGAPAVALVVVTADDDHNI